MPRRELAHQEITKEVIGAFFDVYNGIEFGLPESVYHRSLVVELKLRGLRVRSESKAEVWYKGERVGCFYIDILVEDCIILEIKASRALVAEDRRQLFSYLRAANSEVGLLLHFGPEPNFERMVNPGFRPPQE